MIDYEYLFHVTASRNRLAIERYGLKARRTGDHNYKTSSEFNLIKRQPLGVYATIPGTRCFTHGLETLEERRHIWRIKVAGLAIRTDPVLDRGWSYCIQEDISPERLELVHCFNYLTDPPPLPQMDGCVL